jgi:hypothetical protein
MNMKRGRIQKTIERKRSFKDKQAKSACIHIKNNGDFCMKMKWICASWVSIVVDKSTTWRWGQHLNMQCIKWRRASAREGRCSSKMGNSSAFIGDGGGEGKENYGEK